MFPECPQVIELTAKLEGNVKPKQPPLPPAPAPVAKAQVKVIKTKTVTESLMERSWANVKASSSGKQRVSNIKAAAEVQYSESSDSDGEESQSQLSSLYSSSVKSDVPNANYTTARSAQR
jgi:hypothetical protein